MSTAEILAELPKLNEADRRAISRRLLELATEQEEYSLADANLIEACKLLDKMEGDDAQTKSNARTSLDD